MTPTPDYILRFREKMGIRPDHTPITLNVAKLDAALTLLAEESEARGRNMAVDYVRSLSERDTFMMGNTPKEYRGEMFYVVKESSLEAARKAG